MDLFRSIRWDNAGDGEANDWYMELPMANGLYEVSFYLCDASDARHYKLALEGEIVEEDVHQLAFPTGVGINPGPTQVGRYSFEAEVTDGSLSIGLLPCQDCPGVADFNPILQGLEVLENAPCDPEEQDLGLACSYDEDSGRVNAAWDDLANVDSWRVLRNGEVLLPRLPAAGRESTDANPRGAGRSVRMAARIIPRTSSLYGMRAGVSRSMRRSRHTVAALVSDTDTASSSRANATNAAPSLSPSCSRPSIPAVKRNTWRHHASCSKCSRVSPPPSPSSFFFSSDVPIEKVASIAFRSASVPPVAYA